MYVVDEVQAVGPEFPIMIKKSRGDILEKEY
jgi:hypothetical protein